jgi:hypothetical protein
MPLVPAGSDHAAQVKALIKQSRSLSLGTLVGFLLADKNLNLLGKQAAYRGTAAGR